MKNVLLQGKECSKQKTIQENYTTGPSKKSELVFSSLVDFQKQT